MKNLQTKVITSVFAVIVLYGCQQTPQQITDQEKQEIISEISQLWEYSVKGIEEHNAEQAFSIYSNSEGTKYIRGGYIFPSIDKARDQYASWFKNNDAVKHKLTFDPVIYDVLDRNTVLMTAIGSFEKVEKTDPDEKPMIIAYTTVWRMESDGWKVLNMHTSFK